MGVSPDLGELYNEAARSSGPDRTPLIVIPGMLGSNLVDSESGKSIWGAWEGDFADPRVPAETRLIALPLGSNLNPTELTDGVENAGALDRIRLRIFGFPVNFKAYAQLLLTLGAGGYRDDTISALDYGDDHFTCFQFDYDWRLSNSVNAKNLAKFIEEKKAYLRKEYLSLIHI